MIRGCGIEPSFLNFKKYPYIDTRTEASGTCVCVVLTMAILPAEASVSSSSTPTISLKLPNGTIYKPIIREDGYLNGTKIASAVGKQISHWYENKFAKAFLADLSKETKLGVKQLYCTLRGNGPKCGTWIHPRVLPKLLTWLGVTIVEEDSETGNRSSSSSSASQQSNPSPLSFDFPIANHVLKFADGSKCEIIMRESDRYVNATHMAKTARKKANDWIKSKMAEELVAQLLVELEDSSVSSKNPDVSDASSKSAALSQKDVIITSIGRISSGEEEGGTWIHPDLVIPFAQWLYPAFSLKVSRWIQELLTKGEVKLQSLQMKQLQEEKQALVEQTKQIKFKAKEDKKALEEKAKKEKQALEEKAKKEKQALEKKAKKERRALEKKAREENEALEKKNKQLELEAQLERERLKKLTITLKQKAELKKDPMIKKEVTYIKSTLQYAQMGIFKIGIARKNDKSRSVSLNTSHIKEDELVTLRTIHSTNAAKVENYLHDHFESCHHDKEWFNIPYSRLMKEIDDLEKDFDKHYVSKKKLADDRIDSWYTLPSGDPKWTDGLDLQIFNKTVAPKVPKLDLSDPKALENKDVQIAVLKTASKFVNKCIKPNPPVEHSTFRLKNEAFIVPMPAFRKFMESENMIMPTKVGPFNKQLSEFLNYNHKQVIPTLKRPQDWNQNLEDKLYVAA